MNPDYLAFASVSAGVVAALVAALAALTLARARLRSEQRLEEMEMDLAAKRLDDREGIEISVRMPDGGSLALTFPRGTDPESVEQVVKNLIEQYNIRPERTNSVEGKEPTP